MNSKLYFLSKLSFLSVLTTQELTELAEDFVWQEFEKGEDIIVQGQTQQWFYILTEGRAESLVSKQGIKTWQVSSFGPGDAFGELSMFTGKPAPTTVRCLEKSKVLAMDSDHFAHMLLRWPKLNSIFLKKLSYSLNKVNYNLWESKQKDFLLSSLQLTHYEDKFYGIWGSIRTTKEVEDKLAELSQSKDHLLLIGERGTGRQMFAWYAHKRRFNESAPFIGIDGRRFDQEWSDLILESQDKDNKNDPVQDQKSQEKYINKYSNLIDIAAGGTLFIREINLISPRAQLKLAQSLDQNPNCFVIGTLQGDPGQIQPKLIPELEKCFKQRYKIKPLRERKRDIPVLTQGILEKLARKHHRTTPVLNQETMKLLLSHNYRQGNVTELIQVMERAFFMADKDVIGLEHIFFGPTAEKIGHTINLLAWPSINKLLQKGAFINWMRIITSAIFFTLILLLVLIPKTTLGTKLFIIVWGLWWPALAIISPFLGRLWCTVCPFSFVMDLFQKKLHFNRPVPDFLKKYDYLLTSFLFSLIFWIEVVTDMRSHTGNTVILLLSIQLAAIIIGVIFTRHTWCHHLCPLGGFVGTASIGGMLEVRADPTVCLNKCTTLDCYVGSDKVPGCPMSQHLPYLDNNLSCKLCLNCVRNCPNGSVQLNLRVPALEVWHLVRVNQGFAIFIGVTLAILVPINYFQPLRNVWPLEQWRLWFSLAYWGSVIFAGILSWLIARPFKTKAASRRVKIFFAFIPLVLTGHIIYQLRHIPGAQSLMLGLGIKSVASGAIESHYIPAFLIGKTIAITIGAVLTAFTIIMVLLSNKEKQTGKPSMSKINSQR